MCAISPGFWQNYVITAGSSSLRHHTWPEYKWQKPRMIFSLYRLPALVSSLRMVCMRRYSTRASSRVHDTLVEGPSSSLCSL